jgi:glycosyltransferase involved in cell wall biosynthesis
LAQLYKWIRAERPELVLSFTPKINIYFGLLSRLLGQRYVPSVTGLGSSFLGSTRLRKATTVMYRRAFRGTERVFFQNASDRDLFVQLGIVTGEQTALLPGSGVDLDRFHPTMAVPRPPGTPFTFLMIARLLLDKGVLEFSEAASQLCKVHPETVFRLVGRFDPGHHASIPSRLLEEWRSHGPIQYVGEVSDVRDLLRHADCVVLPSYREGMPRAILEASAMGIPTIVSDAPGCRDAVADGDTGMHCRVKDAGDLARRMREMRLLADDARKEMGRRARMRMERGFSVDSVVRSYLDLLDKPAQDIRSRQP